MAQHRTITGYVANDPRQVQTKQGRDLAVLRILENNRVYDRQANEWRDGEPTGYDVAVGRDGLRENVLSSLQKGQRVSVEGRYEPKAYLGRDSNAQVGHQIYADDISASMLHDTQVRGPAAATADRGAEVARDVQQRTAGAEQPQRTPEGQALYQEAVDSWAQQPQAEAPGVER